MQSLSNSQLAFEYSDKLIQKFIWKCKRPRIGAIYIPYYKSQYHSMPNQLINIDYLDFK